MRTAAAAVLGVLLLGGMTVCNAQTEKSNPLQPFVAEDSPVLVLEHVRVIDGTGAPAKDDQWIEIANGKIVYAGLKPKDQLTFGTPKVIDMTGKTVFPGLVGMHEHLFYPLPDGGPGLQPLYGEMADSAPRLYLAGGVTSARTAGSLEPYTDISDRKSVV